LRHQITSLNASCTRFVLHIPLLLGILLLLLLLLLLSLG
jgi:hypothetical protein